MTTMNVNASRPEPRVLDLGLQNENIVEHIVFDISSWIEEYGEGVAYIYAQRSGDAEPYPVTLTMGEDTATWTLTTTDTNVAGKGRAQLVYTVSSAVKKTKVYPTFVHRSLGAASAQPPDPYENWLDTLGDYTASIEQSVGDVQDLVDDATDAKNDAISAKTAAQTAQGLAESARNSASAYADLAAGSASDASDYAHNASLSAADAAQSERDADGHATSAQSYATDAGVARLTSEAYAVGTREGLPIPGTDPAYNNHAKYWAQESSDSATSAWAAETSAEGHSLDSEAYAKGTRGGEDVGSGDAAYHNNSLYYSQQAAASALEAKEALEDTGMVDFTINSSDHLIYTKTIVVAIDFDLDNRGHLIVS